jgi:hypothetical protein
MSAAAAPLVCACLAFAGCIGPMNISSVRADFSLVTATGSDLKPTDDGTAFGFEIARGTDADVAFGPLYFAFAYSFAQLDTPGFDDTIEHRAGTRWRSSVLQSNTSSYPYAAVGVYLSWLEMGNRPQGKFGAGAEGGYGFRIGLGPRAAFDIEALAGYGISEGGFETFSIRLGGALVVRF